MIPQKGYYSVIQYCPDLGRVEAVNLGVLLFCPESGFLKAITADSNSRVLQFFGREGYDPKWINSIKKSFHVRLKKEQKAIRNLDDLRQFIATRANMLQLTRPLPMKVLDPERDLEELYEQILGQSRKQGRREGLRQLLAERFRQAGLENKIAHDVSVNIPVLGRSVEMPFGFQNGRFNLINPVRFEAVKSDQSFRTACKYAVEGRSIYEHPSDELGQLQLLVVGQFRPNDEETRTLVQRVFDESHVKLYPSEELTRLIEEIQRTGLDLERARQVP
jgi:hypothetical protein